MAFFFPPSIHGAAPFPTHLFFRRGGAAPTPGAVRNLPSRGSVIIARPCDVRGRFWKIQLDYSAPRSTEYRPDLAPAPPMARRPRRRACPDFRGSLISMGKLVLPVSVP